MAKTGSMARLTRRRLAPRDDGTNTTLIPLHFPGANGSGKFGLGHMGENDESPPSAHDGGGGGGGGHGPNGSNNPGQGGSTCGASPNPLNNNGCIVVNENDGRLQYTSGWNLSSASANGAHNTTHSTVITGSSVVVNFQGTGISAFGIVPQNNQSLSPTFATYTLDGGNATSLPLPGADKCIQNQVFYQAFNLPAGSHNLTINATVPNQRTPYILDYLWICGPPSSSVHGNMSSNFGKSSLKSSGPSKTQFIALAAALGSVVFLVILAGLLWWLVRRRKRRDKLRQLRLSVNPVSSWLRRPSRNRSGTGSVPETEVAFTSTESIMRENTAYGSSADSKSSRSTGTRRGRRELISMPMSAMLPPDSPEMPPGLGPPPPEAYTVDRDGRTHLAPPPWASRSPPTTPGP
ncbi:hypothetical protein BD413DRAFT_247486 [Trametes elegans]|nr:hypothetical protein BD413DRAFT_247486 [Trametes elegans]